MKTRFIVRSLVSVFALTAAVAFAEEYHSTASFRSNTPAANSADSAWMARHAEKVAAVADVSVKKDIVFIGDELTADWETTGADALATYFTGDKAMFNLGFAGDCTEHALWRIKNGELGNPKAIFLMIGGNNTATYLESEEAPGQTTIAVRDIIDYIRSNHGTTKLVVQAILPRGADESDPVRARNDQVNNDIRKYVQSVGCTWVDMSDLFLESDHHTLKTSLYNDDKATLNAAGYAVWGQAVQDYVTAAANGTAMPSDLVATARPAGVPAAAYPSFSTIVLDKFYWEKYDYDVSAIRNKSYDIVLLGDSITQKWSATDPSSMSGLATSVFNLGRSGDFTENLFWRLNSGCLDGYTTKYFNLLIGTNNTVQREPSMDSPADIAAGVKAIIDLVLAKHPESKILLMPILPYGSKNKPEDAAAKHANNVAANEIIKTYADNQRVFLVNVDTSKFYLDDGLTCNPEMYDATEANNYYLHLSAKGYSEIIAPAIKSAMASTAALSVSFPQVGSVSAKVTGTAATLTLSDVVKGTDASGAAASSYKVTYKLDTAAETTLAANETGASATVGLADLADGWHTCAVSVSADGVVKSAVKRVKFQIDTNADKVGWKVAPMDADGSAFRDDGTQVFARGYTGKTVNGITFSSGFPSSEQATVSPSTYSGAGWGENNPVFGGGWVWSKSGSQDIVFTLKGLTSGHKYCVQILAANHWSGSSTTLSAGDLTPFEATKNNDYKYGAVFSRVFVASGSTEDVTIGFSGSNNNCLIKAVQLRDLGAGSEEDPTHEDDPVDPPAGSAWIPDPVPGSNPASEPCTPNDGGQGNASQHANDKKNCQGKNFDLVMLGDSVTENWGATGVEAVESKLKIDSSSDGVFCIGIGGNRTQHMIWRCQDGALGGDTPETGYTTKYFTLLAGVNNVYQKIIDEGGNPDNPEDIAEAIRTLVNMIVAKHPESKILLMPILPYAFRYEKNGSYLANHLKGIRVRETTEDVNDIIIRFVDNKRIFWVDVREKFVLSDGLPNFELFGGPNGSYDPDQCLHPRTTGYDFFNTAVKAAMEKYQSVAVGTAQVTDPSLGLVTYSQSGFDAVPTIGLSGIYLGTDANAVPVTSYSVAYELDGGAKKTVLSDATATRNSFTIADVAPGAHTVKVTVTTADNKVMTRELTFTKCDGWVAEALSTDDGKIRKDGTLKCAYALDAYTLNDVPFAKVSGSIDNDNMTADFGIDGGGGAPTGVATGDYLSMLKKCWWANAGKHTVTLKQLTPGHNYLVQIIACRILDNMDGNVWIDEAFHESYRNAYAVRVRGDEYPCGGSLTGVFTAGTTGTKTFSVVSDGNHAVNAIQVRDLGDSGVIPVDPVNPINPSIGSVSASVNGSTATISLNNIVKGTDDNAVAATSYSVSYSLNSAAAVTALSNQSAATAAFSLNDLADGDYTCSVTITTDKGKTSASKSVNFTIKTSTPGGDDDPDEPVATGWTVEPMSESGDTIRKDGEVIGAYSIQGGEVNGVTFSQTRPVTGKLTVSPAPVGSRYGDFGWGGLSDGSSYRDMISHASYWNSGSTVDITFGNLTSGHKYLVQFVSHNDSAKGVTISAEGTAPQHICSIDGDDAYKRGASIVGVFTAQGISKTVTVTFAGLDSSSEKAGEGTINAIQIRDLGEGGEDPVDPEEPEEPLPVYTLTIPAQEHLSVESVKTNNVAVTGAGNAYSIVSNTEVTVTFAAETGYEITGGNPVVVTVESNMTLAEFPTVQEKQGGDDPDVPTADGWTAAPMSETGDTIRKDGDLVYAYSRFGGTVNTVEFSALGGAVNLGDVYSKIKFRFTTEMYRDSNSDGADDYANILVHRFVNGTCDQVLTLKELESGSRYLVQLVLCFPESYAGGTQVTAPDGITVAKANGSGWENGGSLVGVFTATNSTVTFDLAFEKWACMNAIQVRKIAAEDPVSPADPPVIGGEGVDVPMAVTADKVSITISNAAIGHTYGYKKSTTLEGLADAEVIKLDAPAATAGVLTLDIPKDPAEPTCFYQIVVE